jgi:hypothetical protein
MFKLQRITPEDELKHIRRPRRHIRGERIEIMRKYYFKHGIVSGIYCFTLKKFIRIFSLFNNDKIISGYGCN